MISPCTNPECPGGVILDGFCDRCGFAPVGAPGGRPGPGGPGSGPPPPAPDQSPGSERGRASVGEGPIPVSGSMPGLSLGSEAASSPRSGSVPQGSGGRSRSRVALGAGLTSVPDVPRRDLSDLLMSEPVVPESRRACRVCRHRVGRARPDLPARARGFCPRCGTPFDFIAPLGPGDLVAGQYEIVGVMAHGGMGWVYLAVDRAVADRYVVLKGVLDPDDDTAREAAAAERRTLAAVDHPLIVKIHNFVPHRSEEYIVMELVPGRSLRELQRGQGGRLALQHVLAFGIEILAALDYLHRIGLLYCDLKPDNVMQVEDRIRLIDLGAARRVDAVGGNVLGTRGYHAPELADGVVGVASDLYTVGRTLAVLSIPIERTGRHLERLPDPSEAPLLAVNEAYHRLLRRSTDPDPARRFATAAEMAEQVLGVLAQTVALDGGVPVPVDSTRFTTDLLGDDDVVAWSGGDPAVPTRPIWSGLPRPVVDLTDPGAQLVAGVAALGPDQALAAVMAAPPTVETLLHRVARLVELGREVEAGTHLDDAARLDGAAWRIGWWRGLLALAGGDPTAVDHFTGLVDLLPGELGALLALAAAEEAAGKLDAAARHYETVARTDPRLASAVFGLARVHCLLGNRDEAARALGAVDPGSRWHTTATAVRCRVLAGRIAGELPQPRHLADAGRLIPPPGTDPALHHRLRVEILSAALLLLTGSAPAPDPSLTIAGAVALEEGAVRDGLEDAYRRLADLAPTRAGRIELVDRANQVRRRSPR